MEIKETTVPIERTFEIKVNYEEYKLLIEAVEQGHRYFAKYINILMLLKKHE